MKKFVVLLAAVLFSGTALLASETAVKKVVTDLYQSMYDLNGDGVLALFHPEFTSEDGDGKKSIEDVRQVCKELDDMKKVLAPANLPDTSLAELMQALFAMRGDELDAETLKLAKEMENTAEGRKLKETTVKTLQEMEKIFQKEIDAVRNSVKIISVTVKDDKAVMIYTVKQQDETEKWSLELTRKDEKWLIRKLSVSVVE